MKALFARPRWRPLPLAVVTILAWLPAILLATALAASDLTGCQVDEGSVHPCWVAGFDIGESLYTFAVSGWLMLVTLPFMMLTAIVWAARGVYLVAKRSPGRS